MQKRMKQYIRKPKTHQLQFYFAPALKLPHYACPKPLGIYIYVCVCIPHKLSKPIVISPTNQPSLHKTNSVAHQPLS